MENEYYNSSGAPIRNILGISIEGETRNKLYAIITWSKITAIGGFVNLGLNIIMNISTYSYTLYRHGFTWLIITNLVSLAISFFLNFFLWQFNTSLKKSLDDEDQGAFVTASMQLKAYMRMLGILFIVTILIRVASSLFIMRTVLHY